MGSASYRHAVAAIALFSLLGVGLPAPALPAWFPDGVPICTETHDQFTYAIVADGAHGAIVIWVDRRFEEDIFAQRVDASGVTLWATNGLGVCTAPRQQSTPVAVAASGNGAVVFWSDARSGGSDLYAQRLNGAGVGQWTFDGIPIASSPQDETRPLAIFDGSVGIFAPVGWNVLWVGRDGSLSDLRMNRVDFNGALRVPASFGGTTLVSGIAALGSLAMASDGIGTASNPKGAVVVWSENRFGGARGYDIYARRMNGSGTPQWSSSGVAVCDLNGDQENVSIVNVGTSVIMAWDDLRTPDRNIWAQKLDATGSAQWLAGGLPVCQSGGGQFQPLLVSDGAGGVIVAWIDVRSGVSKIYAQRLDANGQRLWMPADGVPLCSASGLQTSPAIATDGAGGAIVAWQDRRNGVHDDLYAQRVDANGALLWGAEGAPLSRTLGNQQFVSVISDGESGVVAAWTDHRGGNPDVFANRIFASGAVDAPAAYSSGWRLAFASANPTGGEVRLSLAVPRPARVTAEVLDATGRRVRGLERDAELGVGMHPITWDGADDDGARTPPGVFFVRVRAGAETLVARVVRLR